MPDEGFTFNKVLTELMAKESRLELNTTDIIVNKLHSLAVMYKKHKETKNYADNRN